MLTRFIVLLCFMYSHYSKAQWSEQNSGTFNHLRGIDFIDSLTGITVGHNGEIIKTVDGGQNWNNIPSPNNETYWKIHFFNDSVGWIVGAKGTLLKTKDRGESWNIINIGITTDFESIFFINDSIGWICGKNGIVYKTIDTGNNWVNKSITVPKYLSVIHFINDSIGFLRSEDGIYRTDNGGDSWLKLNVTTLGIHDVFFINNSVGWFCGENGSVYKTENGGLDWVEQESHVSNWLHDIHFVNLNYGWIVGRKGKMIYTINGGETWFPYPNSLASNTHIISVDFTDVNNGWACASSGTIIKYTKDPNLNTTSFSNQTLNIYPNPVSVTSNIQFSQTDSEVQLALYDIKGRNLGSSFFNKTQDRQYEFTRGILASGLYYIVVENQDSVWSEKIVLE